MRVAVTNKASYPIGRGGYSFPPEDTRVVNVTDRRLREIRACVHLKTEHVPSEEPPALEADEPVSIEEMREDLDEIGLLPEDADDERVRELYGAVEDAAKNLLAEKEAELGRELTEDEKDEFAEMLDEAIRGLFGPERTAEGDGEEKTPVEVQPGETGEITGDGSGEALPEIEPRDVPAGEVLEEATVELPEGSTVELGDSADPSPGPETGLTPEEEAEKAAAAESPANPLACTEEGCEFVAASEAGLATHARMKHDG